MVLAPTFFSLAAAWLLFILPRLFFFFFLAHEVCRVIGKFWFKLFKKIKSSWHNKRPTFDGGIITTKYLCFYLIINIIQRFIEKLIWNNKDFTSKHKKQLHIHATISQFRFTHHSMEKKKKWCEKSKLSC